MTVVGRVLRPRAALALLTLVGLPACASTAARPTAPPGGEAPAPAPATPRAEATSPHDLAGPLRLDRLLPILLERSPAIRQARARLCAVRERYPQAIALPDPMVEATWYARNAMDPDRMGPTRWNLMLRQGIPFPTVLNLRGRIARTEARAEAVRYEATVRDAVTELRELHSERWYLAEAEQASRAARAVYVRLAELARSGTAQGRTTLPESFRAEALAAQAEYDARVLHDRRAVEDARLRALLDLPGDTVLGLPAEAVETSDVLVPDAELSALAELHNQELTAAGLDARAAELGVRRARAELAPALEVGAGLMRNDDFEEMSGRSEDSVVLTLGMTLPMVNPARHAAVREAAANADLAKASEVDRRQRLRADVARSAFRVRNTARLASLYDDTLLPQAESELLRSREMVAEGQESASSGLELAAAWQALKISRARAVADNAQAVTALERLLGTTLAAVPSGGPR